MNKHLKVLVNGVIKENPIFVLLLGMCPTLATTSSAINGMSMGLATMFVLICSNAVISLLKNVIPDMVRIPAFIVVIATFVTIIEMMMNAYVPALADSLGIFIPLIVVNCIVLGRAESLIRRLAHWAPCHIVDRSRRRSRVRRHGGCPLRSRDRHPRRRSHTPRSLPSATSSPHG